MTTVPEYLLQQFPDSVTMRVTGTSMTPTILDEDGILIDVVAEPRRDDVVAVFVKSNGHLVGRLQRSPRGAWLSKDNVSVPRVFLGAANSFVVTGVVRYVIERGGQPVAIPINVRGAVFSRMSRDELTSRHRVAAERLLSSYQHLLDGGLPGVKGLPGRFYEYDESGQLVREVGLGWLRKSAIDRQKLEDN